MGRRRTDRSGRSDMSGGNAKKAHGTGSLSAVSAAFMEHSGFLKRFLKRYFSDRRDIEDVAQEAYLRAYAAERRKEIDQPKSYLFRIAKNLALTELTKKANQITDYLEEAGASVVPEIAAGADGEAEARESLGLYCEAVAALPEKCRQVYLLRKVHGLKHREIAERMSLSVSSVEKYLLQGVVACRTFVDEREGRVDTVGTGTNRHRSDSKGRR